MMCHKNYTGQQMQQMRLLKFCTYEQQQYKSLINKLSHKYLLQSMTWQECTKRPHRINDKPEIWNNILYV